MAKQQHLQIRQILSHLSKNEPVIYAGRRQRAAVSEKGSDFYPPKATDPVQAYIRTDGKSKAVVVYNTLPADAREEMVKLGNDFDNVDKLKSLYGYEYNSAVDVFHKMVEGKMHNYIRVYLKPKQVVVLKS